MVYHSTFLHTTLRSGGPSSLFVWNASADFYAPPKKKKNKEKEHLIAGYRDTNVLAELNPKVTLYLLQ